ncbi:hypothetical protein [Thalassotalea sp. SU-HH00458]|uniref:hypothetical protein n=1 Tax=Thalassotalea sp. SU-HH00458 TaxID=3127657 RepID=UPI003109F1B0
MFKHLFSAKPVIDDNSRLWIFDTFEWAIKYFNREVFLTETELVLPTNAFYPGRVGSVEEMAHQVFTYTVQYAGMQNWPLTLVAPQHLHSIDFPRLNIEHGLRGKLSVIELAENSDQTIKFTFNPSQINQPQDLIASYVQQLATILVMQQKILPPGGKDFLPQAIDILSCVMGFGVIFTNTAYQFKGGCGSCYNPRANRQAALSEQDTVYALALFCLLKSKKAHEVKPHLKSHLRKPFTKAYQEISSYQVKNNHSLFLEVKP